MSVHAMFQRSIRWALPVLVLGALVQEAGARVGENDPEKRELDGFVEQMRAASERGGRRNGPLAIPDIFGPGSVLNVGNVHMKITNNGFDGNPFTNLSSDPSGQWPGASSVEYVNFIGMAVGAVNPTASDPTAVRRVSYITEWRPATLDPEDRIYRGYDGIINGIRFGNDDSDLSPLTGDELIDEDPFDGRDNDGDGRIDEDYAAIGQQMYSMIMRDDTPQAINQAAAERHVPLGIECRKLAWAYSIPGFQDFNVIQYQFFNRSGHVLDSLVVGWRVDMDCGPIEKGNYFSDDLDLPRLPHGDFFIETKPTDRRLQPKDDRTPNRPAGVSPDSSLCPRYIVRVQGFSVGDDDGDDGKTPGIPSFLLLDHTIDPTGSSGPAQVNFRMFRSHVGGTPYNQGGNPTIDQQRFELMTSVEGIDPETGFINREPGDQRGDYQAWCSVGPWFNVPDGGMIQATVAVGVQPGTYANALTFQQRYDQAPATTINQTIGGTSRARRVITSGADLLAQYATLSNALAAQIAFEGAYESPRAGFPQTNDHGRETARRSAPGIIDASQDCRDLAPRQITDRQYEFFDYDCDYCTGAWSPSSGGYFHRTWLAESPPPSPNTNLAITYNYSDNADRNAKGLVPGGDGQVLLAWDNVSETTPDPKSGEFDFRGYKIWKVSNWTRPVGSGGPNDDDWTLVTDVRLFDHADNNRIPAPGGGTRCPRLFIPETGDSMDVCLERGDLWDRQTGLVLKPNLAVECIRDERTGECAKERGRILGLEQQTEKIKYPVGRYKYIDRQVKNGFLYFYSITAYDSSGSVGAEVLLNGRRAAVEAEGVVPQSGVTTAKGAWVVPNPYRGTALLRDRPSAWDLTPNASDPTGTSIAFMGLPRGPWKIKIFTVSGDLVEELNSTDAVNESIRGGTITNPDGSTSPGYNRQQDNENDGQARWNLISRNGQDIVSGIYLFTVESRLGSQTGKFIVIR